MQWHGFWFLTHAQTIAVYAGADGRVDVLVDGALVLRRNVGLGMHAISETITLGAGSHEINIRYEHDGGGSSLDIQRALEGEPPGTFVPTRLFPEPQDIQDVRLVTGTYWLIRLVAVLWLAPTVALFLVVAGLAGRRHVHHWRTVAAPRTVGNFGHRLRVVVFPALLGPFVVFLLGPHTIYDANRGAFGTIFTDIAWPWLLMAVGGGWTVLLGIGCVICLLSNRLTRLYAALLFAVGVLLWAQGNFLVADYGLLSGLASPRLACAV